MMGTVAALCLSSCMNEDFPSANSRKGSMSLSVDYLKPTITRAGVETSDFHVAIYEEDDDWYCTYEKASLIPNKIAMPIGAYYVKAHTPGTLQKIMESPYYAGVDEFEIYMQDDSIILKKHKPACVFCGAEENCIEFENQKIWQIIIF